MLQLPPSLNVMDHVNDAEKICIRKTRKQFEYDLNVKSTKQKLVKGAKRTPFEIVENSNSTNLVFSVGAWHQIVLPTIKYFESMKECKIDENVVTIESIDGGNDRAGKKVDTLVTFMINNEKVVCHFYNTTHLILCNGPGYKKLIQLFFRPFFEARVSLNSKGIQNYNDLALSLLNNRGVKRSSVRIPTRSTALWCTKCDFVAKSNSALTKHKRSDHYSLDTRESSSSMLAIPPYQSTKNNTINDMIMQEDITLNDLSLDEQNDILLFSCLVCDWKTKSKKLLDDHLDEVHNDSPVTFVCRPCSVSFSNHEDHKEHMNSHERTSKESCDVEAEKLLEESIVDSNEIDKVITADPSPSICETPRMTSVVHEEFICSQCKLETSSINNLRLHINSANDSNKDNAISVIQEKMDLTLFSCDKCLFKDKCNDKLQQHIQLVHQALRIDVESSLIQPFYCHICDFKCNLNIKLKKHIERIHAMDATYTCEECSFTSNLIANI